jgi:hypothetical protein
MAAVLAPAGLSCSASTRSARRAAGPQATGTAPSTRPRPTTSASASTTSTTSTTTATSTTSTTDTRPALPAPRPITPLVSPVLPGEGSWQPAGDRLAGGFAIYTTVLRPAAGVPESGIAWIDSRATLISLYGGIGQPYGSWPQQSYVAGPLQQRLMAAFNSGFKIYNYSTGWYDQGQTALPLQAGVASLVIYSDGAATVADWGRDATLGDDVVAVRQNLPLLVDHGTPTPLVQQPYQWGAVLGGGSVTWRSAVGVTVAGDLVYAAGPDLTPGLLANLMVAAGAERAMELDINPEWVSFATFTHAGGIGGSAISGANLLPGMYFSPNHYLQPYSRDFFTVFARGGSAQR